MFFGRYIIEECLQAERGYGIMEFISQYVVAIVWAICLCLGYIIKHSISFIPNKYIPLIMAVVGVILNVWISGWKISPEILLGGMASGLASTGSYEMVRNLLEGRSDSGNTEGGSDTGYMGDKDTGDKQ